VVVGGGAVGVSVVDPPPPCLLGCPPRRYLRVDWVAVCSLCIWSWNLGCWKLKLKLLEGWKK